MSFGELMFSEFGLVLNLLTFFISLVALVFWVQLFQRMHIVERQEEGWLWIFSSVFMVLLLNLMVMLLLISSGRLPLGANNYFIVEVKTLDFVNNFSRMVMAVALSIGTYKLYSFMNASPDMVFKFTPIELVVESSNESAKKYILEKGTSYLVCEDPSQSFAGVGDKKLNGLDLLVDNVTHGSPGLIITRKYPQKILQNSGLSKTPIIWLTSDKDYDKSIHPADITELSHTIKTFISKGGESVLVDGLEYIIVHNTFPEVLKFVESVNDAVSQTESTLIFTIDPSTLDIREYHLLARELTEYIKD